ncbi:extracellular solute-binding protein [Neobacillus sp. DY30]|uniref:ABC transporter substrate-binding protein n=1 Tax=Neobacillus sp. DY30 TaxID=3047871 RepID=UPI0024C06F0A|nr:extracellular solute-binding protein [Neobacillus sp. DY30]WHY02706.1 extracellular solute-binding protein [Neobacillus sp. DY30]
MMKSFRNARKGILPVLLLVVLVISGCSSKSSGESKNVITVPDAAIWGEESSALQTMYDLYQKDHPEYKIKQVTIKEVETALAAGEGSDLLLMDPFVAKESFKQGYVEPLDKYYEKYQYDKEMFQWAKNAYAFEGKTIGIPWNYEGLVLVYNKTLFKENNWEVPQNYSELESLIKELKKKDLIPLAWGTADCASCDNWWISSIVNSTLGQDGTKQLFSGDKKWTDPEMIEAVQRYSDFWNNGYLSDKKSHAISQEDSMQLFAQGKAAMKLDGTWSLASDLQTGFDIGYAPFPSWDPNGKPVIPLGVGGGLVINAKSKHKDQVAELLSYFFHEDVVEEMAKNGIPEPINADFSNMDLKPNVAEALNLISEAASKGETGYVSWSYGSPRVVNAIQEFPNVYLKKTTPEKWLEKLQELKEKDIVEKTLFDLGNY